MKSTPGGVTLLGLGPGDPGKLTLDAWELLNNSSEIYLRTDKHPVVASLPTTLRVVSFDDIYARMEDYQEVYDQIVEQVLALAERPQGVIYAVPGHPFIAEATAPVIAEKASQRGYPVHIVGGMSFLEPVFVALGVDPFPRAGLLDAFELSEIHHPSFPPDMPVIITQLYSKFIASEVKLTLMASYPDDHLVTLVHAAGTHQEHLEELPLHQIDRSDHIGMLTCLYVPPLHPATSFERFQNVIARLRAPDGCPWDREQTHLSLRPYLLEEVHEALAALDAQDPTALQEELGDLLIQIVLHAQIASEQGDFTMADILRNVHLKLVHRHPHVFGEMDIADAKGVEISWDKLKTAEREKKGDADPSVLDGVPLALPALAQAYAYQQRAARVGFDWAAVEGVIDKILEELEEVRQATDAVSQAQELGDLLFAVVNLARWHKVDAESILRQANARFRRRFIKLEKAARFEGKTLDSLTPEEMDRIWEANKAKGGDY